jgi:hypothetical protein
MAIDLKRWISMGMLVIPAAVSLVLVAQSIRRITFVIEHGGIDCATCDGSPVAFLIGWGVELLVLLVALLLTWFAWRRLRHVPKAI